MTEPQPSASSSESSRSDGVVLGIDLGTTNSLAAVMTAQGPRVLRDRDGEALVPSVVAFLPSGEVRIGREARAAVLDHRDRTVHSIKRLIGRAGAEVDAAAAQMPYPVVQGERGLARVAIDGRLLSPEEVSAMVLREVARIAQEALAQPIAGAVITVPAYFDDAQRQATKDAAELAELDCLRIVNEPTAAALAYGLRGDRDGTVLVYDLGGGTFDVSALRIHDGIFRVLATAGNTALGGDDFDRLLLERVLAAAQLEATGAADSEARQAIARAAESLKMRLSEAPEATLVIEAGDGCAQPIALRVTRAELEEQIAPLVAETMACCRRAVADAGLTFAAIDHVVLVGGSTRVPLVRRELEALTGKPAQAGVDPELAVACGAAIQADVLAGGQDSLLLLDVIPLSLGIETMGGVVSKLILRNSTIPASHTETFSTQVDNQTGVDINVYQGEREQVEHCRALGAFKLTGIPPAPGGLPRIAVTFLVDADGVLRVSAREQRTGVEAGIQIVPSFGLTRDEVRRIMAESIEHAAGDMREREAIELRNKATAMVGGTRQALERAELPPEQTFAIASAVQAVEEALARSNPGALRDSVDHLSHLTAQVADDLISSAVRKALAVGSAPHP